MAHRTFLLFTLALALAALGCRGSRHSRPRGDGGIVRIDGGGGGDAGGSDGGGFDAGGFDGGGFDAGGPTGPGDRCTDPLSIPGTGGTQTFVLAGRAADHTPLCSGSAGPDVAFRFVPSTSGIATFESGGIDTVLGVYSAATCDTTVQLGCDDDGGSTSLGSLVTLEVTAGTTYFVVVAAYSSSPTSDPVTLTVTLGAP